MHEQSASAQDDHSPIRVFLLDDHETVRRAIADLLSTEPGIEVVGEVGTADEALHRIPAARPHVVVLDARLPDSGGAEVCREIRLVSPQSRCLILTSSDDSDAVIAAVMAGAAGYLLKEVRGRSLVDAIRQIAVGHSVLDPAVTERVMARLRDHEPPDRRPTVSDREREVLELICEGYSNHEIGQRLHRAEKS